MLCITRRFRLPDLPTRPSALNPAYRLFLATQSDVWDVRRLQVLLRSWITLCGGFADQRDMAPSSLALWNPRRAASSAPHVRLIRRGRSGPSISWRARQVSPSVPIGIVIFSFGRQETKEPLLRRHRFELILDVAVLARFRPVQGRCLLPGPIRCPTPIRSSVWLKMADS